MKKLTMMTAAVLLSTAGIAYADDINADESTQLVEAGTILSVEKLNDAIYELHPGANIHETELERDDGRYEYEVEIRDADGVEWDITLDASTGAMLKNERDD